MSIAPRTVDQALAWSAAQSTDPTQNWHDYCLKFCHDAYGIPARYATAYDAWLAIPASAKHVGGNPDDAPLGAFLFYKGANPAGHIMIAARPFPKGLAAAWSNDLVRDGFIDKADRHAPTREWGHEYLGWSYQVNGYDVTPPKRKRKRKGAGIAAGVAAAAAGAVIGHAAPPPTATATTPTAPAVHAVGWYNVEYGHPVAPHVRMILGDARRYDLDVMGVEEVQDYVAALRVAATDYTVIGSAADTRDAILVKKGIPVSASGSFKPSGFYYSTKGRPVTTAAGVWARVRGVTYVDVHAPVQAWVATAHGRRFIGPARRLDAYRRFISDLVTFARVHPGRLVVMGDWNATPDTRGVWSPNYLRRLVGGRFIRPNRSTGHGEIDFAIGRGVTGRARVRPNLPVAQSDHLLVTTTTKEN